MMRKFDVETLLCPKFKFGQLSLHGPLQQWTHPRMVCCTYLSCIFGILQSGMVFVFFVFHDLKSLKTIDLTYVVFWARIPQKVPFGQEYHRSAVSPSRRHIKRHINVSAIFWVAVWLRWCVIK